MPRPLDLSTAPAAADVTPERVVEWLALFIGPDDVAELRALHVERPYGRPVTVAGFFDGRHLADMAETALALEAQARGVYFTLNPLRPEILARRANRVDVAEAGDLASDHHVTGRRWLLVDVDPVRVPGIGSTDAEKAAARGVADAVRHDLDGRGWPAPIVADSGNGWHLFYRIDLPTDDSGLVQRCLVALAQRHDTDAAKIDKCVCNAARIVKVPGTVARKGDATQDRPHRRGGIVETPAEIRPAPAELLNALAAEATPATAPGAPELNGHAGRNGKAGPSHRLDVPRWLTDRGVAYRVKDGTDAKGRSVYVLAACPFDPAHTAPDAAIFQADDGKLGFKCLHNSCADRGWKDAKEAIGPPDPDHFEPSLPARDDDAGRSHAAMLIDLALPRVELFHDGDATYATLTAGTPKTVALNCRPFAQQLRHWAYDTGLIPSSEAVRAALDTLAGRALFDGPELPVRVRLAELDGAIYLDLGRDDWSAVRVTAAGWDVVQTYPVRFRHPRGMLPLPLPKRGGNLAALRELLNVGSDTDWRLLVAWLLSTFRPTGPFPLLILTGEQGAAKSTLARLLRSLIDPNAAALRCEPRDGRDLVIAAVNSWVVALDNLSRIPAWLSDALCRLATGGGFATRALYTDAEETIFDSQRPALLTAIDDVATRGDLLDRAIVVRLPAIPEDKRRPESAYWAAVDAARPALLGAILDVVSAGLRTLPSVRLDHLPRMADFARWAMACEPGLDWPAKAFMSAYVGNVADANELALDASPIWTPLRGVVDAESGDWQGTAAELLAALEFMFLARAAPRTALPPGWPRKPHVLSGRLRRLAPNARRAGIGIDFDARYVGKRREKIIRLTAKGAQRGDEADGVGENTGNPLPARPLASASDPGASASPPAKNHANDGARPLPPVSSASCATSTGATP
jgi:hypothetical protein